nr:uncharacterized protein LOC111135752 isoform X2 [Crassostrea virginica]
MISDSSQENQGFRAEYSGIDEDYDKTINDTEGTVSSPRYNGKYPNNVDHYVTIMNREGSRIVLQFLLFDVHSTDFLEIQNGVDPFSPNLIKLTGSKLPNNVYGYGQGIRLHFKSDLYFTESGYSAKFTVEEVNECLDSDSGMEYIGTQNTTVSGVTCLAWRNAGNSSHENLPENFCRNPDGRVSPWCFTGHGVVEYCSIEKCPTKDETKYQATNPTSIQPDTKVKSGSSSQGVGVTAERGSDVTEATPTKKTTPRKIVEPAGKPDDTVYETSNNGEGQASHRDFLVPATVGGVSLFMVAMVLVAVAVKRKQMRNQQAQQRVRRPSDGHIVEGMDSTSGEVQYGRSRYHPSNIHIPSVEITYTAIDNVFDSPEPAESTSSSLDAMDSTLRRFCDGKRLAVHFDEDGYGIVDDELKDDFDDNRFTLKRSRDGDYDHLRSFKVKWDKADEEVAALYDNCQASVIRESQVSNDLDDTYDHTSTVMLKHSLRESQNQSASDSNIYNDCISQEKSKA